MKTTFDRHFFTQIGLDSAALTMLGTVVHGFGEPGEYRGTVRTGDQLEGTFYVSVDQSCAVAQVNIDLAALTSPTVARSGKQPEQRFVVHPKGYAVFHVTGGRGGYWINVRRAEEDRDLEAYDSRRLQEGDIFSGILLRPGTYSITNTLSKAQAEATVAYPSMGKTAYQPPAPIDVECGETFRPRSIRLSPMQGLNFQVKSPTRIKIELTRPDDGPRSRPERTKGGTKKGRTSTT
jgi:hypothetical protein